MAIADARTLETLDFAGIRERVVAGTHTERGRALAGAVAPLTDFQAVVRAQLATAAVRELVAGADFHVRRAVETAPITESAAIGRTLSGTDLRAVAEALASAAAAYRAVRARPSDAVAALVAPYAPTGDLVAALTDAIDERGAVQDRASATLARVRRSLMQAQGEARERVGSIARSGNRAIQDAIVTIRDGRFVVPIKAEFAGEFAGIVHDSSASGQTLFVEPLATLETNNRVRTLRLEEEREVARVLEALSKRVGEHAVQIDANVEMLARLDVLAAKAALAIATDAIVPELSDEPELDVVAGRHPLLSARAVPQSLAIDGDTRFVVISGPNMGGKTVALKTIGLFVAMTYAGLQLPAALGTRVGRFSRVVSDIGDEQSIAENTSTFAAHVRRLQEMLDGADERTLVLVDEIGGGTEPATGAALAIAFLERLLELGARGVVTTHATELKLFAHAAAGVANASVRFDPQTFAPTYALDVGSPGQSLAFPLARTMGLDEAILARAQALLDSRERDYETALAELAQRGAELHRERDEAAAERLRVAQREVELREQRDALARERATFLERAQTRMAQALRDFVTELQRRAAAGATRAKVTSSQSALLERTVGQMRRDLGIVAETVGPASGAPIAAGDRVRVASLQQDGDVVEDFGDSLLVAMGSLKTVVKRNDATRIAAARETPRRSSAALGAEAKLAASARSTAELDVRGKRFAEAEPLVDRWIDEALLAGNSPLRLIHGKGTGMLGSGLQAFLREHPAVASVRYGSADEGDGGVTIVELRER
jgi:DNA mismatch repair protein MutS2